MHVKLNNGGSVGEPAISSDGYLFYPFFPSFFFFHGNFLWVRGKSFQDKLIFLKIFRLFLSVALYAFVVLLLLLLLLFRGRMHLKGRVVCMGNRKTVRLPILKCYVLSGSTIVNSHRNLYCKPAPMLLNIVRAVFIGNMQGQNGTVNHLANVFILEDVGR